MDFIELEKQIEIIAYNVKKDKPEFNSCRTSSGLKFQQELSELMNLMKQGNYIRILFDVFYWMFEGISDIIFDSTEVDLDEEFEIKSTKEKSKVKDLKVKLRDLFDKINISGSFQKITDNLPVYLEALNSYYILALFTYLDYYSTSIYELIISNNSNSKIEKLLFSLKPKGNPSYQIKIINENLQLITKNKFKKLLKDRTWKKTFEKLIKLRNILAHEEPKVKKQALIKSFPSLYEYAKDEIEKDFAKQPTDKSKLKQEEMNKIREITEQSLEMMLLLTAISTLFYFLW